MTREREYFFVYDEYPICRTTPISRWLRSALGHLENSKDYHALRISASVGLCSRMMGGYHTNDRRRSSRETPQVDHMRPLHDFAPRGVEMRDAGRPDIWVIVSRAQGPLTWRTTWGM